MRGPPASENRLKLVHDLPGIEKRMRRERIMLTHLGQEYGLSLAGVKKAIRLAGYTDRLTAARETYHRRQHQADARKRAQQAKRREKQREARVSLIRKAIEDGKRPVEIARMLDMNLANLNRFMKRYLPEKPETSS